MASRDILQIGVWNRWYLTLRFYEESNWGLRRLSYPKPCHRWALDFGFLSLVVKDSKYL